MTDTACVVARLHTGVDACPWRSGIGGEGTQTCLETELLFPGQNDQITIRTYIHTVVMVPRYTRQQIRQLHSRNHRGKRAVS